MSPKADDLVRAVRIAAHQHKLPRRRIPVVLRRVENAVKALALVYEVDEQRLRALAAEAIDDDKATALRVKIYDGLSDEGMGMWFSWFHPLVPRNFYQYERPRLRLIRGGAS